MSFYLPKKTFLTRRALETADRVTVLESGQEVWKGTAEQARSSSNMIDALRGLKPSENRRDH